mgnify:CR=1 FL=1
MRTFEVGEKALWLDGYFVFDVSINQVGEYACRVVSDETKISHEALICDLYRKTPEDLARLKSRIHDLRYHCTNLMEELDLMIEKNEGAK